MEPSASTTPSLEVLAGVALVTLQRPRQLNVIGPEDVRVLADHLRTSAGDPHVRAIVLRGTGERAFCAGGDVKYVHERISRGEIQQLVDFWAAEFELDHLISTCPKPVVALMHGLTLGGGLGLAAHAHHRVVTTSATVGMPETLIGLSPDVGMTWRLARSPGASGDYAAVTSARLTPGDAVHMGLADAVVDDDDVAELLERLTRDGPAPAIARLARPSTSWVAEHQHEIDSCFGGQAGQDPADTLSTRRDSSSEWQQLAGRALPVLAEASPVAMAVAAEAVRRARALPDLGTCFQQDLVLGANFARHPDLAEGIRARVVDKDRAPRWATPARRDVTPPTVDTFFQPPPDLDTRYRPTLWA